MTSHPTTEPATPRTIAIMMFEGVQDIDFAGPLEVFGGAGYRVITVAEKSGPLKTAMNLTVIPDHTFDDCPAVDVVLLPGGDVPPMDRSTPTMQWILGQSSQAQYLMSVCNGAFWLARAGLLDGMEATTISFRIPSLQAEFPSIRVVSDRRVVDNGPVLTTAGLSAGIDGALHLVQKMDGYQAAQSVALCIEYNWQPHARYARGNDADKYLRAFSNMRLPSGSKACLCKQEGNWDRWEKTYAVEGPKLSSDDIMKALAPALAEAGWKAAEAAGDKSEFEFEGDDRNTWMGMRTIEADARTPGRFLVTLSVQRAEMSREEK